MPPEGDAGVRGITLLLRGTLNRLAMNRRTALVIWVVVALLVAVVAVVVLRPAGVPVTRGKIGPDGGTVSSPGGLVSVRFEPGVLPSDAEITMRNDVDGPPPVAMVRPLTRPFSIDLDKYGSTPGEVAVRYPLIPPGAVPENIVVVLEEESGWQVLETVVDPVTRIATAKWPHFSRGYLGILDPLFDVADDSARWAWSALDTAADWTVSVTQDFAGWTVNHALALFGGSSKTAECANVDENWSVTSTNINGGPMSVRPLNGCAEPLDDGQYKVKIGNQYPYPYLISLQPGMISDWRDIPADSGIVEGLFNLAFAGLDKIVVAGGSEATVRFDDQIASPARATAVIDPATMTVKIAAFLAFFFSQGRSLAVQAALRAEREALWKKVLESGRSGAPNFSLADFIIATQWNSELARAERRAGAAETAHDLDHVFATLDLLNCAYRTTGEVTAKIGEEGDLWGGISTAIDEMLTTCWPVWVKATVSTALEESASMLSPEGKRRNSEKVIAGLLGQVREAAQITKGLEATFVAALTRGRFDYVRVALVATRQGAAPESSIEDVDWASVLAEPLGCTGGNLFRETSIGPVYADVTGDGVRDALVTVACGGGASTPPASVVLVDGTSDFSAPRVLGYMIKERGMAIEEIRVAGAEIYVRGLLYSSVAAICCPDTPFEQTFSWTGTSFREGQVSATPPGLPESFIGRWEGTASQTGLAPYAVGLNLIVGSVEEQVGTVDFPSFGCGAALFAASIDREDKVSLDGSIAYGSDCVGGLWVLTVTGDRMTYTTYATEVSYGFPRGSQIASGTLYRVR